MRNFIFIVFLFVTKSSLSQSDCLQIRGDNGETVAFATVLIKKIKKVLIADSIGSICSKALQQVEKGDTLFISAVGYEESISVFSGVDIVRLQKRNIILQEAVIVKGKGKIEEWGTKKNPSIIGGYCRLGFAENLNSTARIIYPEGSYEKAEIISASFYDGTGKEMNVPVRIRVYLIGKDSLPFADYLTDNVIVNTEGKGWLKVNLESKGLIFPKEGLAFGIEPFAREEEYYYYDTWKKSNGKKHTVKRYGFSLGMENAKTFMTLIKLNAWNPWMIHRSNINICGNLVCRVKVRVWR